MSRSSKKSQPAQIAALTVGSVAPWTIQPGKQRKSFPCSWSPRPGVLAIMKPLYAAAASMTSATARCGCILTKAMFSLVGLFLAVSSTLTAADLKIPETIQNAFRLGGASTAFRFIGVDAAGNVYIAGRFIGAVPFRGFPVANKTVLGTPGGYPGFYVAKVSPLGDKLLWLTEINDSDAEYDYLGGMVVEADGSVILAGGTRAPDFPTTDGSYQPHASNGGAVLLKIDASGQRLVFSTFLDNSSSTIANAVAKGPDGSYYIAGITDGRSFPTTVGAYQRTVPDGAAGYLGFVSKISADGRRLLVSTLFGDCPVQHMGIDGSGAIHLLDRICTCTDRINE